MYKNKFKEFGGNFIPDIIEYLKEYIKRDPYVTITIGCDSIQKRKKTVYAITIMLYNTDLRNGAHVVFFRESVDKVRDNNERLYKEALYLYDIANYINDELSGFYRRKDLTNYELKKYKFHLAKCNQEYSYVPLYMEESIINNIILLDSDKGDYKLVDIHVDFNPIEGFRNKSNIAYKAYVPWLRGVGFRTWAKPLAHAASTAADLLLQD